MALGVMAIRLKDAGLPSVEVMSALPRDQLLVLGILELVVTVAVAGVLMIAVMFGSLLVVPISLPGLLWAVSLVALLVYLVLLSYPPVWQILLVAVVAGFILTLTRQLEFPSPFAGATVALKDQGEPIGGSYLGSTSDEYLIGVEDEETWRLERRLGTSLPSSLVLVPRGLTEQVVLEPAPAPTKPSESIAEWLGVSVVCLFPECRVGDEAVQTPQ